MAALTLTELQRLTVNNLVNQTLGIGKYADINGQLSKMSQAGVTLATEVTMATSAAGAKKVVRSAGASKAVVADGPDYDTLATMAAAGGAGEVVYTPAADRALAKTGILVANVVTNSTGLATAGDKFILSVNGTDKTVKPSTLGPSDFPTMALAGGAGNLVGTAAADKALSDSGVAIANVVTQAANGVAGNIPAYAAGSTKVLTDSLIPTTSLFRVVSIPIDAITNGASDLTYTIPASGFVAFASLSVTTGSAGGITLDVGVNGNTDGFFKGIPADAPGLYTVYPAWDGTKVGNPCYGGDLLAAYAAGTDADDRGFFFTKFDASSGNLKVAISGSAADSNFRGTLYLVLAG